MNKNKFKELKQIAIDIRRDCLDMQFESQSGHLGGAFSTVEILTYLYFRLMDIDTKKPHKEDRDIFIMSKGHGSLSLYSVLARKGFFPIEELLTYRKVNTRLQGHTHIDSPLGVEFSTGSLGQGLSFGLGIGLGYKKLGIKNKVYVLLGDGEMQEGQIWEGIMLNSVLKLDNVIPIIDDNKIQLGDYSLNIIGESRFKEKFQAFNHNVIEFEGHEFNEIEEGFKQIKKGTANIIIAHTIKGKGISFMEDKVEWHSKKASKEEYQEALDELEREEAILNE